MPDVRIDDAALRRSEESLRGVAAALRGAEARRDATASAWGAVEVAEAMAEFVDNGNRRRGQLVASLDATAGRCAQMREEFAATDRRLGADGPGGRAPR